MSPDSGKIGLFLACFLSATVLPGGSEAVFAGFLYAFPAQYWQALMLATLGNTLGGMTSYALGRLVPRKEISPRLEFVRRHGTKCLILAWTPFLGDALCVAAGVLRLNWLASAFWMASGKFARYWLIAVTLP
ncbi:MAG: DedA family protein [Rhodocyclaceae bacterium]|nr:DedA family protein [Rhodocyclaceae bacterium]